MNKHCTLELTHSLSLSHTHTHTHTHTHNDLLKIRSVSTSEIPKWSTPAVAHRSQPSPQVNFEIVDTEFDRDLVKSVVTVKADVSRELLILNELLVLAGFQISLTRV